jgi:arginase
VDIRSASEISNQDLPVVTKQAIGKILQKTKSFWLHVDLDVLSSEALSAVDYPQPGGLTWEQLTTICKTATANPSLAGMDVTIYNPDLDPGHKHAPRIVQFITDIAENLCRLSRR